MIFLGRLMLSAATGALLIVSTTAADARPRGEHRDGHSRDRDTESSSSSTSDVVQGAAIFVGLIAGLISVFGKKKKASGSDEAQALADSSTSSGTDVAIIAPPDEPTAIDRCTKAVLGDLWGVRDNPRIANISATYEEDITHIRGIVAFTPARTEPEGSTMPVNDSSAFRCAVQGEWLTDLSIDGV